MPTAADTRLETVLIEVQFEPQDHGFQLSRFGMLLNSLWNLAASLRGYAEPPVQDGSPWVEPGLYLVGASMSSPLRLTLEFRLVPKYVAEALVEVLKLIVFVDEEKRHRQLSNELLREEVHAKRLANAEQALRIARQVSEDEPVNQQLVDSIVTASRDIQYSGSALKSVEILEET